MRTVQEVTHAFTPVGKLDPATAQRIYLVQVAFIEFAKEILELVPECADRTAAMRKLLEAKMSSVQALTHCMPGAAQASELAPSKEIKDGKKSSK